MKLSKFLPVLLAGVALSLAGGCKRTPKNVTTIPGQTASAPAVPEMGGGPVGGPRTNVGPGRNTGPERSGTFGQDDTTGTKIKDFPINPDGGIPQPGDRRNLDNYNEDKTVLQAETVYFDFDKHQVKASERSKVEAVATYMKNEPKVLVKVEGNCDERGTEEYNRSLGERRALAVREYLATLGIDPERVLTVSYGEDKPADIGHDEAAWSKNRRDDFVVLKPKN